MVLRPVTPVLDAYERFMNTGPQLTKSDLKALHGMGEGCFDYKYVEPK